MNDTAVTEMKHPGGRPPKFADKETLEQTFYNWKLEFLEGGRYFGDIPDVECFCDYINSYRELLMEYERKPEFSRTVKQIKNWIYYQKKQLAMRNKMPAAIFIFDAKNNAGYVEKTETDITTQGESVNQLQVPADKVAEFASFLAQDMKKQG